VRDPCLRHTGGNRETPQALVRRGGSPPALRYPGSILEFQSTGILALTFYKVDFFSGLRIAPRMLPTAQRYPASNLSLRSTGKFSRETYYDLPFWTQYRNQLVKEFPPLLSLTVRTSATPLQQTNNPTLLQDPKVNLPSLVKAILRHISRKILLK
jgi:hypothetical protein